jgi:hypothetical protein
VKEIDFCREAKKKIDIAVRRESPSGGKKSIFAVQRKNRYRREA